MSHLKAVIISLLIGLAIGLGVYAWFNTGNSLTKESDFKDSCSILSTQAQQLETQGLSITIKDSADSGTYEVSTIDGATATPNSLSIDGIDGLTLTAGSTLKLSGSNLPSEATISGFSGDLKSGVSVKSIYPGLQKLPVLIPKEKDLQRDMCLSLLSMKGSSAESKLTTSNALTVLNAIFKKDGPISVQYLNPRAIVNAKLNGKMTKNYGYFIITSVGSEKEIKDALSTVTGGGLDGDDVVKGIAHLSVGQILAIPQNTKALCKDNNKLTLFTDTSRLKR